MRFIEIKQPGEGYQLTLAEGQTPELGTYDVLIKVAASGVNRADIYQAEGNYPPPEGASDILGLEVSGEIIAMGEEVRSHAVGNKVCALLAGGGYADHVVVSESDVLPIPEGVDTVTAAGLPEAFATAYLNLMELGRLKPGKSVLIHGGASGVGTAGIQLASALGATVYTTAGSKEKCALCASLGAVKAINYKEQDFVAEIKAATDGAGVDVVLDMVGGEYFQKNFSALSKKGKLISIAFLGGAKAEVNFAPLLMKNLSIEGSTLRSKGTLEKNELLRSVKQVVWPLIENGQIKPVIDTVFDAIEAQEAHDYMRENKTMGKLLLKW